MLSLWHQLQHHDAVMLQHIEVMCAFIAFYSCAAHALCRACMKLCSELRWPLQGCMRAMLEVWSNITLTRAFNSWVITAQELRDKRALQSRAMAFWSSRELAQVGYLAKPCMSVTHHKQSCVQAQRKDYAAGCGVRDAHS